ncbi:Phox homologous domain [Phytophthora cactorum]|nr:Phox homologous domain [Phytophthora cactorum]
MRCLILLFRWRWRSPLSIWLLYCVSTARAESAELAPSQEPPEMRSVSTEQVLMLAVDALFLFIGIVYGSRVLAPKPMTYLSEIAFPMDVRFLREDGGVVHAVPTERAALVVPRDFLLLAAVSSTVRSGSTECCGDDGDISLGHIVEHFVDGISAWTDAVAVLAAILDHQMVDTTLVLVMNGTFPGISSMDDEDASSFMTSMVFGGVCYAASAILVLFMFVRPTTVTPDFIAYPTEVNTPSAYLNSTHHNPPTSLYGSFKDWELMAYPSSSKSIEDKPMLDITIPATTSSIWGNRQFVSFKIVVETDEDHWSLRRPYSDFAALHEESRLEKYLKQVLHHPKLAPDASQALCEFLEMEYVEDIASVRSYHSNSII